MRSTLVHPGPVSSVAGSRISATAGCSSLDLLCCPLDPCLGLLGVTYYPISPCGALALS